jgi:predicted acylesterase/phospholipase RssA
MPRLGLALSGGGFRATLYHLGVVRFLKDAGELQHITDIASVSGGSILAAHLALNWDRYIGDDESFSKAASEVVKFTQLDVRNHIVRRLPMQFPLRPLARLHLLKGRNLTPNAILERYYRKHLFGDRCLFELPEEPMLHILTTNVSTGLLDLGVREGEFPTEFFTDGGVYDNMGLRVFSWLKEQQTSFDEVLVSDAGKPFQMLSDAALGLVGQSLRASDILWDRVWQLEREIFGGQKGFVFLPITEMVELKEDPTALHPVVQAEVQSIRTDLDRFSVQEINALAQHGYEVARKVCRQQGVFGDAELPQSPPWAPIADKSSTTDAAAEAPPPEPSTATRLSRQLRKSSRRRVWTTFLDWRDWPSYVYVAIAFVLVFYLPYQVYSLYQRAQTQAAIIESIASGDPDIRQILRLANSNPTSDWVGEEIQEISEPTHLNYEGVEVLTHSRIYDLRWWRPDKSLANRQGLVYVRDRITLKLLDSYSGDGRITFAFPSKVENVEFRYPNDQPGGLIRRVTKPVEVQGEKRTLYELEYDLSQVPPEEPVTIEAEVLLNFPEAARTQFVTALKTDLISVWILFAPERPYRTYSLVSYPVDRSVPPKIMNVRYTIDHPYGSLIGWSVVNPESDYVYECRWKME